MKKPIITLLLFLPLTLMAAGLSMSGLGPIVAAGDTTKPTIDSASVNTAGSQLTISFSESCSRGAGFAASQFSFNDGSANALTYLSGDPGTSWVFTTANTVHQGDTCTLAFDGGATSILDGAGNYADDDASITVTNNSTQSAASVIFYFNCDANTASQDAQKYSGASGAITWEGDNTTWTTPAGLVGNALSIANSWRNFSFPSAGNIDASIGTIGFWWKASNIVGSGAMVFSGVPSSGLFGLNDASTTSLYWAYKSATQTITVAADTEYFIELAWNHSTAKMSYRLNGGSWTEETASGAEAPTLTALRFGAWDGTYNTQMFDQIIISDTYQEDLYSVRTATSF